MIVSASRRTDIPAFYSEWLGNRMEAGWCDVPNPFNPKQVTRVSLLPKDVDAIVFWTRHARPMMPLLPPLGERYRFYFQYTITGYGRPVEARTPPLDVAAATFRALAERLQPGSVVWRYDPILVGNAFPFSEHLTRFASVAEQLEGHTRRVVISVVHIYRKTERRLRALYSFGDELNREPATDPGLPKFLSQLVGIAREHGMAVEACAEGRDYSALGIGKTKCVDDRLLGQLFGGEWPACKDSGQRAECRCVPSKDIGMVDTCPFGCAYCYTTRTDELGRRRHREHDATSSSLFAGRR